MWFLRAFTFSSSSEDIMGSPDLNWPFQFTQLGGVFFLHVTSFFFKYHQMLTGLCEFRRRFYTILPTWFHQQVPRIYFYSTLSDLKDLSALQRDSGRKRSSLESSWEVQGTHHSHHMYRKDIQDEWAILPFCFCVGLFG